MLRLRVVAADKAFKRGDLRFELFDLLARAQQHAALHVELLARDQVELAQAGLQRAAEIRGQVLTRFAQARRYQRGEAPGQFIDGLDVDHKVTPVLLMRVLQMRDSRAIPCKRISPDERHLCRRLLVSMGSAGGALEGITTGRSLPARRSIDVASPRAISLAMRHDCASRRIRKLV